MLTVFEKNEVALLRVYLYQAFCHDTGWHPCSQSAHTLWFRLPERMNEQERINEREKWMRALPEPFGAQGLHLFSLVLVVTCIVLSVPGGSPSMQKCLQEGCEGYRISSELPQKFCVCLHSPYTIVNEHRRLSYYVQYSCIPGSLPEQSFIDNQFALSSTVMSRGCGRVFFPFAHHVTKQKSAEELKIRKS